MLKRLSSIGAVVALCLIHAVPAHANEGQDVKVTFFHSANAEARWVHFTPAPPGDPDTWSIKLRLGSTSPPTCSVGDFSCYAGADLAGLAGAAPLTPPKFDYYSTVSGASGGSPRLVMQFSDGGDMSLRPLSWTANVWATENGATPDWDNRGGTCGSLYEMSYGVEVACHSGATVTDVFVVTDSSWLDGPYIHYIDNISYGDAFITSPEGAGCHESDGDGRFHGDKGDSDFHVDSDGCMDGDRDSVDSQNRGDGQDFHSTQIDSVAVDSVTNTLTVTGMGTSNGVPMTFTLVAVPATALTPGWVSYTFGDGFSNAGPILDGVISLS